MINILTLIQAENIAKHVGFTVELFDDEDIRIGAGSASNLEVITKREYENHIKQIVSEDIACQYIIVGRTAIPPFEEANFPTKSSLALHKLTQHRCISTDHENHLLDIINFSLLSGKSVVSDIYFFPNNGRYVGYVSHHNEIIIDWNSETKQE